ncbi:hypothetical protein HNQ88_003799 [Aureibacter tunicatorum]|uniref:Uncharacterized protein n=1 Tax=Aureibacter tunicatorum TaxID=866807 RepID=A0AAE3XQ90_9BACT|nr:hypothetical protein [Aureibacter tunicatorum]BDD06944.1 hypothetical protein AUTU_44270 [Aureibacter tunicatorum]
MEYLIIYLIHIPIMLKKSAVSFEIYIRMSILHAN